MYKFKRHEYDLTEGEQEQAKFIIKEASEQTKKAMVGEGKTDGLRKQAFEEFKRKFYVSVATRLQLFSSPGAFSLTDDAKKLIHLVIEKAI